MPSFFDTMTEVHDRILYVKEGVREMKNHLQVGQRVKPDPNHESYQGWLHQYEDSYGYVLEPSHEGTPEKWVNVAWSNGNNGHCYPEEMLIPINEEGEEETVSLPEHLQIGQRVRPNPLHDDYKKFIDQHKCNAGVVVDEGYDIYDVKVKWSHGHTNTYNSDMLIPMFDDEEAIQFDSKPVTIKGRTKKAEQTEESYSYDLPILPGERFCLNPESSDYGYLAKDYDLTGYVRIIDNSDNDIVKWKSWSMDKRKNTNTSVQFDNGKTIMLNQKHILPIESPAKTITKYFIAHNGERDYSTIHAIIEGDVNDKKMIDKQIILLGSRVVKTEIYDNDWRANMIEKIVNYEV